MKNRTLVYYSASRALFNISSGLVEVFGVLSIFRIFDNSLAHAILPIALMQLGHGIMTPITAPFIGKVGTRYSLMIGSALVLVGQIPLMFLNPDSYWLTGVFVILNSIGRPMVFTPVLYYMSKLTNSHNRGSGFGVIRVFILASLILNPLIGGIVSEQFEITGLIALSATAAFLSVIPLFKVKNFKFSYSGKIIELLRYKTVRHAASVAIMNQPVGHAERFWQIYVFLLLGSSFTGFGYLFTIIAVVSIVVSLVIGKMLDGHNRRKLLHRDAFVMFVSWILRTLSTSAAGVFVSDVIYKLNENVKDSAYLVLSVDLITPKKNSLAQLDEHIVVREMITNLAAGVALLFGIIIVLNFGFQALFFFTALTSLFFLFA